MKSLMFLFLVFLASHLHGQFAPQAGFAGSTAIHKDSNIIKAWAPACTYVNGWMNIADVSMGGVSGSIATDATGYPDGATVSLGDMGSVTYYFENPLVDSQGYDFAVYENGFRNPDNPALAFLEFAIVEASTDGVNWNRFQPTCNLDTFFQIPMAGVYVDASKVNNLAGKYVANYGTPFDLFELAISSSLDLQNVHFIRVTDVVGTLNSAYCARDQFNRKINDPYPTPINTGGFDLDGLGIIHRKYPVSVQSLATETEVLFYPNPSHDFLYFKHPERITSYQIMDAAGRVLLSGSGKELISISSLPPAMYILTLTKQDRTHCSSRFQKW